MSETPSVLRYAMSPVSMLTATSLPHGVGPHSRCRSGSPAAKTGERPDFIQLVGLPYQSHRLKEVRRVRHEQMQPGIVHGTRS